MKIFKRVVLFIVVVLVAAVAYIMFQPAEYNVSRSKVIKAPVGMVYNAVNDLRSWEQWGPWHDDDTTIVVTYGDKTVGLGASSEWLSKDGPGNMKVVAVEPNKSIALKLQFEDYEPGDLKWTFEEVEEGTKITWIMEEDNAPFVFKMVAAFMGGWDAMLGPMQEQGLDNLNAVMQKE
ncbi:MAG: SRPBCC family protein, partial [Bacteroidota bacterium]